jgi:hypothetical protein
MSATTVQTDLSAYVEVKTTDKTPNILDLITRLVTEEGPWSGTVHELQASLGLDISPQSLAVLLEQSQVEIERHGITINQKRDNGQHVIAITYEPETRAALREPPISSETPEEELSPTEQTMPVEYPVTFPFSWIIAGKKIATISELSQDDKKKAKRKRRACSLCGRKGVDYEKLASGFAHLICTECATRYVLNAYALKRRVER